MKFSRLRKNRGFTLIELLTAMVVFSIIIVIVGNITSSVIKAQRKIFAVQNAQEASRFIMEMISKEIRASMINTGAGAGLTTLNITNADSETFDYQFDNTNKRFLRKGEIVSPSNVEVTGEFYINEYTFPSAPTRKTATIIIRIMVSGSKAEQRAELNLQNTIAPRSY
ncbi:prepilin-type N-terminal cleavage/methylation domain-containing protein [Patescibacteria group bacterium]|nr:prepilin-type N-terminal cleavage/methylation domain-containing protein [Patescibacteria group bacterium]